MTPSAAFRADVAGHLPAVTSFARSLTHDVDRASDLSAAVMLRAIERESQYQPGTKLLAWLFTITRNVWYDQLRRSRLIGFDSIDMPSAMLPVTPPMQEITISLREIVDRIAEMPPSIHTVMTMIAEGDDYQSIADRLGVPLGTLRSRLWRARTALREVSP